MSRLGPALRLRLVVYGLLAVCAVMALGARGWWPFEEGSAEEVVLTGRTDRGENFVMLLRDRRFHSFSTRISAWCPSARDWHNWNWYPNEHVVGVTFRHEGRRLYAHEPTSGAGRGDLVLRGELAEDGQSVRGTIAARGVWGRGDARAFCAATVGFSARRAPR